MAENLSLLLRLGIFTWPHNIAVYSITSPSAVISIALGMGVRKSTFVEGRAMAQ